MNVHEALMKRKMGITNRIEIGFAAVRILRLKEVIKLKSAYDSDADLETNKTTGPLACASLDNGLVAVANEDGYVNLLNTQQLKDLCQWEAHTNAIFDLKASLDKRSLFTASGDTSIKVWDVETRKLKTSLNPHFSSIKSISVYDDNVIASGSRDGSIKIHDLRINEPTVMAMRDAHRNRIISKNRKNAVKTDPTSVVTNVTFEHHFPRLYSSGANDATIKLWDLRKTKQTNRPKRTLDGLMLIHQPILEEHHPSTGVHCGYSHLLLSSCKLYAACSDNKIYCYENFGSKQAPFKFTGYRYDTYLKLSVMDDRFLLSGSKGGGALIWSLDKNPGSSIYMPSTTRHALGQLKADDNDTNDTNVIETDWSTLSIITFRDDRLVCKWTMQHVLESDRKKLVNNQNLASVDEDVTIQMSDIIDVNVLRPNQIMMNNNSFTQAVN